MGINYGPPPIITDNLIFYIDAADLHSHPRSGTTWYDIMGNSNVTLDSDCTWSALHGGCIDFDGNSGGGTFTHPNLGTDSWTIEVWVDPSDNYYNWITFVCNTRGGNGYNLGTDSGRDLVYYDQGPQGGGRKLEANLVSPTSGMHLHTYTRDSDNSGAMVGYVDATQVDTGTSTANLSDSSGFIGRLNNGAEDLNGRIACIRMYKGLALSQAQVTHNFNAQRARFGV